MWPSGEKCTRITSSVYRNVGGIGRRGRAVASVKHAYQTDPTAFAMLDRRFGAVMRASKRFVLRDAFDATAGRPEFARSSYIRANDPSHDCGIRCPAE